MVVNGTSRNVALRKFRPDLSDLCFGKDQGSKFHFPRFFLSQLSFQFFAVRISESWLARVIGFQSLLRTLSYIYQTLRGKYN